MQQKKNVTHAYLNEVYPSAIRRDTWKETKPPKKDGSNRTLTLLSCTWKMSFECQEGHRLSWKLSYFLQSLQPNAEKVHHKSFILNHPVVLQCSRKKKNQPNATWFNNWHSTLLHVSIRREWLSYISHWAFKTHKFLCFECGKIQYDLLRCVVDWRISILILRASHITLTLPPSTSYPVFRLGWVTNSVTE